MFLTHFNLRAPDAYLLVSYLIAIVKSSKFSFSNQLNSGLRPDNSGRDIVFTDVEFKYPARPDVPILQGLSLTIRKGETVALVGTSGCGKSTCIQLVQRFYDPENGKIELGESRKN